MPFTLRLLEFALALLRRPLAEAVMLSYRYPRHQHPSSAYPERLFTELERNIGDSDPLQIRRMAALVLEALAHAGGRVAGGLRSEVLTAALR